MGTPRLAVTLLAGIWACGDDAEPARDGAAGDAAVTADAAAGDGAMDAATDAASDGGTDSSRADAGKFDGATVALDAGEPACEGEERRSDIMGMSVDGLVNYRLVTCTPPTLLNRFQHRAVLFELTWDGHTDSASGDAVVYANTQHNWYDSVAGTLPDRVLHYWLETEPPDFVTHTYVRVDTREGAVLLARTPLD